MCLGIHLEQILVKNSSQGRFDHFEPHSAILKICQKCGWQQACSKTNVTMDNWRITSVPQSVFEKGYFIVKISRHGKLSWAFISPSSSHHQTPVTYLFPTGNDYHWGASHSSQTLFIPLWTWNSSRLWEMSQTSPLILVSSTSSGGKLICQWIYSSWLYQRIAIQRQLN